MKGDHGLLLTFTQRGGTQLAPHDGTIFFQVIKESDSCCSIAADFNGVCHTLISAEMATEPSIYIYSAGNLISSAFVLISQNLNNDLFGSDCPADMYIRSGGRVYDLSVGDDCNIYVSSGGIMTSVAFWGSNTILDISSGGVVNYISGWGRYGEVIIEEGGIASNVDFAGSLHIRSGGTALQVSSNAGIFVSIDSGGYIEYIN